MSGYYVYITTNIAKTVLYVGVTNDLNQRIVEHYLNRNTKTHFTGKYNVYWLVRYEEFKYVGDAIAREKEIKGWTRRRKNELIASDNPGWQFLNEDVLGQWPPKAIDLFHRKDRQ
jgi:putative endonuclease